MPKRFILVFGMFLLTVLLYVDRACISAAKGPITEELGLDNIQFGIIMSAFALGYALFQTPSGWLADKLGPRYVLSSVVALWSIFTGLTGMAWNFMSLLVARFLFGAGEAGAFPGLARAIFSWVPMRERGLVQGINFSGSRLGAAFAFPLITYMVVQVGWRGSFLILLVIGFAWALFWLWWFRDTPEEKANITPEELEFIQANRQHADNGTANADKAAAPLTLGAMLSSRNIWLLCVQYFCSNFTFFFGLSWLFTYMEDTYGLTKTEAGLMAALPLLFGAAGNWVSGWLVDRIYRMNHWTLSRSLPAIIGFVLAASGMLASIFMHDATSAIIAFSVAIFGADMTLSSSWSACIDIGRKHAGVVSGTMNMAGNLGSFAMPIVFPLAFAVFESYVPFFILAACLNVLAVILWTLIRPQQPLETA